LSGIFRAVKAAPRLNVKGIFAIAGGAGILYRAWFLVLWGLFAWQKNRKIRNSSLCRRIIAVDGTGLAVLAVCPWATFRWYGGCEPVTGRLRQK